MSTSGGGRTPAAGGVVPGAAIIATIGGASANDARLNANFAGPIGYDGDYNGLVVGPMAYNGATWDRQRTPNVFKIVHVVAIGTETTIWTPAAGKKFRLMGFYLGLSAADRLSLRDNTGGTIIADALLPAADGRLVTFGNGILSAAANNVLTAQSGGAANLTGTVFGTEE